MASEAPNFHVHGPASGSSRLYRTLFAVGVALLLGSFAAGLVVAVRANSTVPYGSLAYAWVANQAARAGDDDRALDEFQGIFRVNPEDRMAGLRSVDLLQQAGRNEEALAALREVASRTGDSAARVRLAMTLNSSGRRDEARALLGRIVESDPDALMARVHLGDLLVEAGEPDAALRLYREAIAIAPHETEVGVRIRNLERQLRGGGS